jgi:hypothetical protein
LVDEPEQPISREEFLRELRKQGVKPTGEEIGEDDIRAAWEAQAMLVAPAAPRPFSIPSGGGQTTVDWHRAPIEPAEQLDLFAAAA